MLEDFVHIMVNYICKQEVRIEELEEKMKENSKVNPQVSFSRKVYHKLKRIVKGE